MAALTRLSSSPITTVRPASAKSIVPQDVEIEVRTNTQAEMMFKNLQNMLRDFKKFDNVIWSERLSAKNLNDLYGQFVKYKESHQSDNRIYCGIAILIPLVLGTITGLAALSGDENGKYTCGAFTGASGLGSAKFIYNKLSKSYVNDLNHLRHIANFALKQSRQHAKLQMNLENWYFLYHESIKKMSNEEHKTSILNSAPDRNTSDIEITNRTMNGDDTKRSASSTKSQENERKESPKVATKAEDPDKNDDTKRSIPSKKPQENAKRESNTGRKSTIAVQRRGSITPGSSATPGSPSLSSNSGAAKKQPKRPATPGSPNLSANTGPTKTSENRNPAKRNSTVQ